MRPAGHRQMLRVALSAKGMLGLQSEHVGLGVGLLGWVGPEARTSRCGRGGKRTKRVAQRGIKKRL